MWLLNNTTPFAAERTWVRDRDGAEVWIVAVKGSFLVGENGQQSLDAEQTEVFRFPQFSGSPEKSSLLHETDLVHQKQQTDVLVFGHAFSPRGQPTRSVDVRLKLANIDKTLRVHGDRVIEAGIVGPTLSAPRPYGRMPIIWERSFGGTDQKDPRPDRQRWEPRNPVGLGFGTELDHVIGTLAPNVEYPSAPYGGFQRGTPASLGPVARHWMPRIRLAGTYDSTWQETRSPLLPSDFDERFYQCAPEDQRIDGFLRGGELVELFNLSKDGYLAFPIPRIALVLTTRFYDGTDVEHRPVLHSLILEPDRRRFQLVWHSALPCHVRVNKLQVTRVALKRRVNVPSTDVRSGMWVGV